MTGSPIIKRTAPARNFEDYTLVYEVSDQAGLYPVTNDRMSYLPNLDFLDEANNIPAYGATIIDIGFTFSFNGINYKQLYVSARGWAALSDPEQSFVEAHVTIPTPIWGTPVDNAELKDVFDYNHVVLSPWFDTLRTVFRSLFTQPPAGITVAADYLHLADLGTSVDELLLGKTTQIPPGYDPSIGGIKYFRDTSYDKGKCLVIRWKCFSFKDSPVRNVVTFDLVLYENGTIEFRYIPRSFMSFDANEAATIGIFSFGGTTGQPRYRDFGILVSTKDDSRGKYKNGGAVYDGSYQDQYSYSAPYNTIANYTITLNVDQNWPGRQQYGAIFRFLPPINKRKITRKDIGKNDSKKLFSEGSSLFDDEQTLQFSSSLVSCPTGIPTSYVVNSRFADGYLRQNLLSSGSIELTREVIAGLHDEFLINNSTLAQDSFSEVSLHEQGNFDDEFFATGSLVGEAHSFSKSLSSKEQIKLTFPVKYVTRMLANTCSLYYYNIGNNSWNIPTSSIGDIAGPFDKTSAKTTGGIFPLGGTNGTAYIEDKIGFDSYGKPVVSGNLEIHRNVTTSGINNQTLDEFGQLFSFSKQSEILSKDYPNSFQRNSSYEASKEETFVLPITQPFMLEKAVIDIPFCMGSGWFYDKTVMSAMFISGTHLLYSGSSVGKSWQLNDIGGPALTISLLSQKNYGTSSIRDLIASSVITHDADTHDVDFSYIPTDGITNNDFVWVMSNSGIDEKDGIKLSRVTPVIDGSKKFFSGSVKAYLAASISNGSRVVPLQQTGNIKQLLVGSSTWDETYKQLLAVMSEERIKDPAMILSIDAFGRGMTGFSPSGGSIFGKEYITMQDVISKDGSYPNALYVADSSERDVITTKISSSWSARAQNIALIGSTDFSSVAESPYLIYPGEKLLLVASKTRPAIKDAIVNVEEVDVPTGKCSMLSSSFYYNIPDPNGHDVQFNSGTINITLYGSYVRLGSEYTP